MMVMTTSSSTRVNPVRWVELDFAIGIESMVEKLRRVVRGLRDREVLAGSGRISLISEPSTSSLTVNGIETQSQYKAHPGGFRKKCCEKCFGGEAAAALGFGQC
jgi:hypothetical protein